MTAGLSGIDKDSAIKSGLSKGGEVIKRGGMERLKNRMRAGLKTGNLLRSFTVRVKRNKPSARVFKKGKKGGNHSHLVDLGTVERMRKHKSRKRGGKGGRTGAATPNYFWNDTNDLDKEKAMVEIRTGIAEFVEKVKAKCMKLHDYEIEQEIIGILLDSEELKALIDDKIFPVYIDEGTAAMLYIAIAN